MATLHVRNVPDALYEALRSRARVRGRSIGNEAIAILAENVARNFTPQSLGVGGGTLVRSRAPRERLSEHADRAIAAASYEAHALGHEQIETEHILLALLGEGAAVARLESLGVPAERVRESIEAYVERGASSEPGPRPFGPGTKRVFELALRESLSAGEGVIGHDHMLVALAADAEGVAGRVLRELGAEPDKLRVAAVTALAPGGAVEPGEEYCAVTLTGSAEEWTEQLNARARGGWRLVELVAEAGEQRAVFRRRPSRSPE